MDLEDKQILDLIERAKAASENAYCPYSNYRVGAAVLTFDNRIYSGCNIENAAFSQTIHAEENAVSQAIADGLLVRAEEQGIEQNQVIKLLAVFAPRGKDPWPCCNCRQFLSEFGTAFWVVGLEKRESEKKVVGMCFAELVPHLFSKDDVL